jgi:predicted RNase H-like HicB family nuclease
MCPEVGTISQGLTMDEAVLNLKKATELYLADFPATEIGQISLTTFEVEYPA